jgi:signal transduction histidine kinase
VHDGLAQVATSAHHHLQAYARRYLPKDSRNKEKKDLGRSLRLVKQTVSEARRVIANLRPRELDDLGLAAAVSQEVKRLRREGWRVDYEQKLGDERLPAELETALFRAAQEALTNARKHAKSGRLRVELSRDERTARLRVRDWGQGFDPDKLNTVGPGERVGISGMRERVALLGGRFELWSQLGEGTSVSVEVPLSATTEYGHGEG